MALKTHLRLGDILVKEGLITTPQLQEGVDLQKKTGKRLGEVLVELRYVTEIQVAGLLGKQLGLRFCTFSKGELTQADDPALKGSVPIDLIRKQLVLPLRRSKDTLTVALMDPLDLLLTDNLKKMTGLSITPVIATKSDLVQAIEAAYGKWDRLKEAVAGTYKEEVDQEHEAFLQQVEVLAPTEEEETAQDLLAKAGEARVIRLVDLFLMEAVNSRASDIHFEPYPNRISIRFRIDGILHPVDPPAPHLMLALISRVKVLSRMDIAEKRLPQDGSFTVKLGDRVVDLRVSSIPVVYGEKVVIRLLDKSNLIFDFKELGLEGKALEDMERGLSTPYGLIFLTGPTGSGKSTTLYAALNRLKSTTKNIISIEDPVEYKVDGVNQVQAKPQIGLTFAAGLRAFLRQDPDIIMVGEVRDLETAEICVQAALTGHLVLSTLHTNDAASAITRLIDLGIAPFLLSPSLVLVAAQRLVRRLCPKCKESYEPSASVREKAHLPPGQYFRPKGCDSCRKIGFKGRISIYEAMRIDEMIRELVARGATAEKIKEVARSHGMKTLLESGLDKAAAGVTSLEEVFGVTIGEL